MSSTRQDCSDGSIASSPSTTEKRRWRIQFRSGSTPAGLPQGPPRLAPFPWCCLGPPSALHPAQHSGRWRCQQGLPCKPSGGSQLHRLALGEAAAGDMRVAHGPRPHCTQQGMRVSASRDWLPADPEGKRRNLSSSGEARQPAAPVHRVGSQSTHR